MGIFGIVIVALLVTFLFSPYRRRDSYVPLAVLFLLVLFAGYAAQFWIVPFGPKLWGVSWLPVLFIMLIFALLFSAPPIHRRQSGNKDADVNPAAMTISVFIWIIFLVLAGAVILGLLYPAALPQALPPTDKIAD